MLFAPRYCLPIQVQQNLCLGDEDLARHFDVPNLARSAEMSKALSWLAQSQCKRRLRSEALKGAVEK